MEITPDEFDYYVREAHRMRVEAMAVFVSGWMSGLARLIARTKSLLRPRRKVVIADQQAQARAA